MGANNTLTLLLDQLFVTTSRHLSNETTMQEAHGVKPVIYVSTCGAGGMLSVVRNLQSSEIHTRWNTKVICSHDTGSVLKRVILAARAYLACLRLLITGQVGIFHVHVAERGSFFRKSIVAFMAMAFGVPVIFHMHAAEFREFYGNRNALVRAYIRRVFDGCSLIIALSESWAAFYAGLTSTPVRVIPNFVAGAHGETPARVAEAGTLRILYLGRLGERKGIYDLIRAVRFMYDRYPGLTVRCGGDGDIEAARRAVENDGMTDRFRILGWIEAPQRVRVLEESDVYVLPSYAEGLPMAIIEAMEAGLAIVATRVGGIPEMIEHGVNGLLIEPGDVDGLRESLLRLANSPKLRAELGRAARLTYVTRYSPDAVIPRLDSIYRDLSEYGRLQ